MKAHYGGHFGHFHDMYINYIFGFHFGVWASYFDFHNVNNISYLFGKKKSLNSRNNDYIYDMYNIIECVSIFRLYRVWV